MRLLTAAVLLLLPNLGTAAVFTGSTTGAPASSAATRCNRGTPAAPEISVTWTATGDGQATATTCPETTYDSMLFVRQGGAEVDLDDTTKPPKCNDDVDRSQSCSTVTWAVTTGSSWSIAVSGYNGKSGPYTLHVDGPAASTGPAPCWPSSAWGRSTRPCAKTDEATQCKCGDSMTWDPEPGVDEYRIFERSPSGAWKKIASIATAGPWTDDDGPRPALPPLTRWIYAKGPVYPAGTLMEYGVRACKGALCSTGISSVTSYRWAPYYTGPYPMVAP